MGILSSLQVWEYLYIYMLRYIISFFLMATMTFLVGRHGSGCNQAIAKRLCLWKSPETKRKKSNLAATKTLDLFLLVFFS